MEPTTDTTNDETDETRFVYAKPADPEHASEDGDDDFEAAAAKALAYIGKAHALFDKFHGDLMGAGDVMPGDAEVAAAYNEGAVAFYRAVQYIDLLLKYRKDERAMAAARAKAPEGGQS